MFFSKKSTMLTIIIILISGALGIYFPVIKDILSQYKIEFLLSALVWISIFKTMVRIDYKAIFSMGKNYEGLSVAAGLSWVIKPFTMYILSVVFIKFIFDKFIQFGRADEYVSAFIIYGAAPCAATILYWCKGVRVDKMFTLGQIILAKILTIIFFVPIVSFLLKSNGLERHNFQLSIQVFIYVFLPIIFAIIFKNIVRKKKGEEHLKDVIIPKLEKLSSFALYLSIGIVFIFQGEKILDKPYELPLLIIPLIIQMFIVFIVGFAWAKLWKIPYSVSLPATLVGISNFFLFAFVIALTYPRLGLTSVAPLAILLGALVEKIIMPLILKLSNKFAKYFASIKAEELYKDRELYYIVDVRTAEEFHAGNIENSVNVPFAYIEDAMKELPKRIKIVTYCNGGTTGGLAQAILEENGFDAHNLKGGYTAYKMVVSKNLQSK